MSAAEVGWRLEDQVKKWAWLPEQVTARNPKRTWAGWGRASSPALREPCHVRFTSPVAPQTLSRLPAEACKAVITAADEVLAGRWTILAVARDDMEDPDWFFDPITGVRAPSSSYCFSIDHRSEKVSGNIKQVWELSRLQHTTVLAAAFALSGDDRYAQRTARHLRSWWEKNLFLSGVHWTSGIELGMRLITWVWVRRLLDGWPGVTDLFENNDVALRQISWHQRYLARFRSRGSSANNHVIAEAAGQLVASVCFDWFADSETWFQGARAVLEEELMKNTFPSGVNREMAFEYHTFVAELGLLAAVEADRAGRPLSKAVWQTLCAMLDVLAATVDVRLQPPRQGDGDDGRGLLLGPALNNRCESLLALGAELFGALPWWPECSPDVASILISSLSQRHAGLERRLRRPCHFGDAGLTIMRTARRDKPEIWCRCDSGPHGFLAIAAHAHADALSVEVRYDGTEVLADPGTYCYHGQAAWRRYFLSTLGHNTVEVANQDQSVSGGPTLWSRHANSRLLALRLGEDGEARTWLADHDGYDRLDPPAHHRRRVTLVEEERCVKIVDVIETMGDYSVRVAFHLGPDIHAEPIRGHRVELAWRGQGDERRRGTLHLADTLEWAESRGETDPVLGWYSPRFGEKQPSISIIGAGTSRGCGQLETVLQFHS